MSGAKFKIIKSGTPSPFSDAGFDAALSDVLQLQLEDPIAADIRSCIYSIRAFSYGAPAAAVAGGGVAAPVTAQVALTLPGSADATAKAWAIRCQTNGGEGVLVNGRLDFTVNTKERIVIIPDSSGFAGIVPGETTEYDPVYGWTKRIKNGAPAITEGRIVFPVEDAETQSAITKSGLARTTSNGIALNTANRRVVLLAQGGASDNGPWLVQAGAWIRPPELDVGAHAAGSMFIVRSGTGTKYAGTVWMASPSVIYGADIVGTDGMAYSQMTGPLPARMIVDSGVQTLVNGTATVATNVPGGTFAASDRLVVWRDTPHGTVMGQVCAPDSTKSGANFGIRSFQADGTTLEANDQSDIGWMVVRVGM